MAFKTLKLFTPPVQRDIIARPRETRESRHERGYGYDWEKRAERHRKKSPVCIECERKGIIALAEVVDHKIPVELRPDLRLTPSNWWSLCHLCHNGLKRRMEAYAQKVGMVDKLTLWCDDPSTRPEALKFTRRRKHKEEMIV